MAKLKPSNIKKKNPMPMPLAPEIALPPVGSQWIFQTSKGPAVGTVVAHIGTKCQMKWQGGTFKKSTEVAAPFHNGCFTPAPTPENKLPPIGSKWRFDEGEVGEVRDYPPTRPGYVEMWWPHGIDGGGSGVSTTDPIAAFHPGGYFNVDGTGPVGEVQPIVPKEEEEEEGPRVYLNASAEEAGGARVKQADYPWAVMTSSGVEYWCATYEEAIGHAGRLAADNPSRYYYVSHQVAIVTMLDDATDA